MRASRVGALAVIGYGRHLRPARRLTGKGTVVLADFANSTGDPVFGDTLKTASSVALNQSPFLNVLSDGKAAATMRLMSHPVGAKLTPEVVSDVCQRSGSKNTNCSRSRSAYLSLMKYSFSGRSVPLPELILMSKRRSGFDLLSGSDLVSLLL